jgi:hypothetical protein
MKGINFYHLSFYAYRAFEGIKGGISTSNVNLLVSRNDTI